MEVIDTVHQLYPDDCFVVPARIIGWAHDSMCDEAVDAHVKKYGPFTDTPMSDSLHQAICNGVARPTLEDAMAHLEDLGKATFAAMDTRTRAVSVNHLSDALRPVARACWPKEQHYEREAAERQRQSLIDRGLERNLARIHVYRCPHCAAFHVGHRG